MTDAADSNDGATAEDETPRGAPKPEGLEGREGGDGESEIPPGVRDGGDPARDRYGEARENANPDQHRDEEAYD